MRVPVRVSLGVLLVLAFATLTQCAVGQRLRLIRRITASDLPPPSNVTDTLPSTTRQEHSNSTNIYTPKVLNITEVFSTSTTTNRPLPAQLNITEILDTSATTHRRQRPVSQQTGIEGLTTTEIPKTNVSEAQLRSRRPYLRNRTSLEQKGLNVSTDTSSQNKTVVESVSTPLINNKETNLNTKDLSVAETIAKSSNNETNSINPQKPDSLSESVNGTNGKCTSNCDEKTAAPEETNISTNDVTKDKIVVSDKVQEASTVQPTDLTFNKIVSSSTARIVLQENIHTDILKHLTTASYAHYETDYVLDLDDADIYEAESSPKRIATKSYDHFNETYTTPNTKRFDEAFARVSEGIRQNLDDITDRSEEYVGGSNEQFSSSDQDEKIVNEGLPKNDTKVSLEFVNHVNIISNDSETANSRHGDLFVDNGTHVDFERKFVQTKIEPEISSTVKYIIDDEYSTTRRIITQDGESNSIKEDFGSEEKAVDRRVEGTDSGSDERAVEQRLEGSESESNEKILDQRLAGAEDDLVRVKVDASVTEDKKQLVIKDEDVEKKENTTNGSEMSTESVTTIRTSTQGRGRMFATERFSSYNNNNTVEQTATELINNKRIRGRPQDIDDMTTTYSPRSRTRSSPTSPSSTMASRRYSTDTIETSPRTNVIRRPLHRRTNSSSRLGDLDVNNEGNDIIANDNFRSTIRRGAVKFGNTRISDENDQFPIPPTAAAWTLATMREPGRRTKLQITNTTTVKPTQVEDSEASGSYSKQTTIYNVIAPTTDTNSTLKDKYGIGNVGQGTLVLTTTDKQNIVEDVVLTTESPGEDLTTIEVPTTLLPDGRENDVTTQQPDELTTMLDVKDDMEDEDLRFDGISRTTTQSADAVELTTEYDNVPTTTDSYETTRFPQEDPNKVVEEEKEEEGEVTTPVPETVLPDEGGISDTQQGEGNQDGHHFIHIENKDIEIVPKIHEIKEDMSGETSVDTQGTDVAKVSEDAVPKEESNVTTHVEGGAQEEGGQQGEEETDYGGPTGPETETDLPIHIVNKVLEVTISSTSDTTKLGETTTTTSATKSSQDASTTNVPSTDSADVTSDVHTFMRVFVEGSMAEFCSLMTIFKKAVADLLTEGTSRSVTLNQVVLRNVGPEQCADAIATNGTTDDDPGRLIPVEMHIVDEKRNYDAQLNDAFPLLWGHQDLDFQLRIRKVDVVDETLAYSGSSNSSGAVIAAITISCIGAICLLILAVLLIVMRKRQKKVNYGMRCTPVSLDAYSLDSVSVHGSTRRKGGLRASKRSYGNPAFEDPISPTHPMNFASLSNFTTDRDGIEEEFSNVPHVTPKSDELPEGAETKNRYANIIPLPETRVVLSTIEDEPLSDYINANYVRGPKNKIKCYIACQGPLQSTVTDFWRMVWERQSKVIMMLTDLVENGVEKCADYLPPSEVLDCHRLFGDFQVTLKKREVRETYVISTLQLKNMESNSWREITHLWYLSWPNQGVPEEPSSIIAFLIEARSYMKDSSGPSVVHCSPGTGRTGTVLACDLGIREFEQTRLVDVPRCVYRLRKDRAGCVQTRDQYAFIYEVLNLYATKLTGGALDSI